MSATPELVKVAVVLDWDDAALADVGDFLNRGTTPPDALASFTPEVRATLERWWSDLDDDSVTADEAAAAHEAIHGYLRAANPPVTARIISSFIDRLMIIAPSAIVATDLTIPNYALSLTIDRFPMHQLIVLQNLPGVSTAALAWEFEESLTTAHTAIGSSRLKEVMNFRGSGAQIGIVDSGIYSSHIHLAGSADFTTQPMTEPSGSPCGSHGTMVAGNAASRKSGLEGPANQASVWDLKVFRRISGACRAPWESVEGALHWGYSKGVRNFSISIGNRSATDDPGTNPVSIVLNRLGFRYDVISVVAAGNSGEEDLNAVRPPAGSWNAISVGASIHQRTGARSDDIVAPFSSWDSPNQGTRTNGGPPKPDLMAPGAASFHGGVYGEMEYLDWDGGAHSSVGVGTSFAAPLVAGAIAQINATSGGHPPGFGLPRYKGMLIAAAASERPGAWPAGGQRTFDHGPDGWAWGHVDIYKAWWSSRKMGSGPDATSILFGVKAGRDANVAVAWPAEDSPLPFAVDINLEMECGGQRVTGVSYKTIAVVSMRTSGELCTVHITPTGPARWVATLAYRDHELT